MTESGGARRIGRSVGAVVAGLLAGIVLSLGTDVVLHAVAVFPPWGQRVSDGALIVATLYRAIYSVAGSYIAARLAPGRPMQHALVLGVIGLIAGLVGAVLTWNLGPAFERTGIPLRSS
jgi:hypothetical protein